MYNYPQSQTGQIQIYEFYPIFPFEQNRNGEWVSKGFTATQVTNRQQTPLEVLQAVFQSDNKGEISINSLQSSFQIPDTHPPQPGEVALIARDIGKYCILAVANRIKDDYDREFVGYRYFWLDKRNLQITDADGIATLLNFWETNNRPSLDLNPHHLTYQGSLVNVYTRQKYFNYYLPYIQSLFDKINTSPALFEANKDGQKLNPGELHCLAREASSQHNIPFKGWAWNVRRLEKFQDLNAIYCADAEALNHFRSQIASQITPKNIPSRNQQISPQSGSSYNSPRSPQIPEYNEDEIRRILQSVAKDPTKVDKVRQLLDCFSNHGSALHQYGDKKVKDNFKESNPSENTITYITLLVIIGNDLNKDKFERDREIINMERGLLNLKQEKKKIVVEFIDNLLKTLRANNQDLRAYKLIGQAIRLLDVLVDKQPENNLFATIESLRKIFFGSDSKNDAFDTFSGGNSSRRKSSSKKGKTTQTQSSYNQSSEQSGMENNDSGDEKLENNLPQNEKENNNSDDKKLSMVVLLVLGVIGAIGIAVWGLLSFPTATITTEEQGESSSLEAPEILSLLKLLQALDASSDSFGEQEKILKINPSDLKSIVDHFSETDNTNSQEVISLLKGLSSSNIDQQINEIVKENQSDIESYLRGERGKLEVSISQSLDDPEKIKSARDLKIYSYIQTSYLPNLTPDKLPDLPKTGSANSSTEDKDVKVLQKVLESNKWYYGVITGNFDQATKDAVIKAQKFYEQPKQDGVVGKGTWEAILLRITDYQVERTLDFMVKSLEKDKPYTEIIKQLNECKAQPQTLQFTICLEEKNMNNE